MTSRMNLRIDPIDTLMFRDGRPFNQSDQGASEATSVFPPYPSTIVGAIRATLWRSLGGTRENWNPEKLGNGTDWQSEKVLGPLSFSAPLILHHGKAVFPAPLHVVQEKGITEVKDKKFTRLLPGTMYKTDLGRVRLVKPEENIEGLKPVDDCYLTTEGLEAVLKGELPKVDQLVLIKDLWQRETRVGIGIDRETRRTDKVPGKGGQLYSASHIRMTVNTELQISCDGWSGSNPFNGDAAELVPLAGEHRMAYIRDSAAISLPSAPQSLGQKDGKTKYIAYLISPCIFDDLDQVGEALKGMVVSACLGKSQMIGGWDSVKRNPIPLRPALPAGSMWFMESNKSEDEIKKLHGSHIGVGAEWGFGQILIGTWQDNGAEND